MMAQGRLTCVGRIVRIQFAVLYFEIQRLGSDLLYGAEVPLDASALSETYRYGKGLPADKFWRAVARAEVH
jgi:hypothetical protein